MSQTFWFAFTKSVLHHDHSLVRLLREARPCGRVWFVNHCCEVGVCTTKKYRIVSLFKSCSSTGAQRYLDLLIRAFNMEGHRETTEFRFHSLFVGGGVHRVTLKMHKSVPRCGQRFVEDEEVRVVHLSAVTPGIQSRAVTKMVFQPPAPLKPVVVQDSSPRCEPRRENFMTSSRENVSGSYLGFRSASALPPLFSFGSRPQQGHRSRTTPGCHLLDSVARALSLEQRPQPSKHRRKTPLVL